MRVPVLLEAVGENVTKVQPGDHVVLSYRSCGDAVIVRRMIPAIV